MKFLIETNKFDPEGTNPWLFDDLVAVLLDKGHLVTLIHLDYNCANFSNKIPIHNNLQYFRFAPKSPTSNQLVKLLNNFKTGFAAKSFIKKNMLSNNQHFDFNISSSVGIFNWGIPKFVKRMGLVDFNIFFLWDFFPIHHLQIGRIRNHFLERSLRLAEKKQISASDHIYVMSLANQLFLSSYHPDLKAKIHIQPPWGTAAEKSQVEKQYSPKLRLIFGGQTGAGRGVDELITALASVEEQIPGCLELLIYTSHDDLERLMNRYDFSRHNFVKTHGYLPRSEYRSQLDFADFGIAITVPNVTAPTFPSKITDYLASGLPVIAVLEEYSDAGQLIESYGAGHSIVAGDVDGLTTLILNLVKLKNSGALSNYEQNAIKLFKEEFDVDVFVERFVNEINVVEHNR